MSDAAYATNVFVNCPFDDAYRPIFDAIVFIVYDCGFTPRCALEEEDSGRVRVSKIYDIVADCRLGIHDISRTEVSGRSKLPRFNMPLELGVFLGATRYGNPKQRTKRCVILDREKYRYQAYLSDLGGQDIRDHSDDPTRAIKAVRDWLSHFTDKTLPGGRSMVDRYARCRTDLPAFPSRTGIEPDELIYNDYTTFAAKWLIQNSRGEDAGDQVGCQDLVHQVLLYRNRRRQDLEYQVLPPVMRVCVSGLPANNPSSSF